MYATMLRCIFCGTEAELLTFLNAAKDPEETISVRDRLYAWLWKSMSE